MAVVEEAQIFFLQIGQFQLVVDGRSGGRKAVRKYGTYLGIGKGNGSVTTRPENEVDKKDRVMLVQESVG